jgi:ubiquinol-cytochrome c reductase cytochrome b subunit
MLGEVAMWSFVVLLLTGVFLTLWFDPSMSETTYQGSYDQLRGVDMSAAYASTLHISFDVRGGLLIRQIHHWAAHLFIAGMLIHLLRVFLTGAFRKPREVTWTFGALMLLLGTLEGFFGYSLPDDLLSGTGLRAADGFVKATPVAGTYLSFLFFDGEFPGDRVIPRLYVLHVLLVPGLILALMAFHLLLIVYHKHTQWPGPGRAEKNVVGYPFFPVYAAKSGGFFFVVFGVLAVLGGLISINPVWKYGPYDPSKVTAGSQPDWYMGWPDGLLRIFPSLESHIGGYTISWNIMIPILIVPILLWTIVLVYPFVEAWITGDKREHHLLQRPREMPARTGLVAALVTFYGLSWTAGGNDIIATQLHLSINEITYFLRAAIILGPILAFLVTRRLCISLQRSDRDLVLHGRESGVIMRSPEGGYAEKHVPLTDAEAYTLTTGRERPPVDASRGDGRPPGRRDRLRGQLSELMYADNVPNPSSEELEEHSHAGELH